MLLWLDFLTGVMFAVAVVVVLLSVGLVSSSVYAEHGGVNNDVLSDYCSSHFQSQYSRYTHYSGCDLSGANLQDVELYSVYISDPPYDSGQYRTDLTHVDLRGAVLSNVGFNSADLSYADLRGARIFDTNLSRAKLVYADFRGVHFQDANLKYLWADGANFQGVDFNIIGIHSGPSLSVPKGMSFIHI